ncbi:ATP-binding protein [Sphingobacterium bambusae]|uniref:histidine kinase n=1 Tax=Sphingobacterium bambusae TaxID=662858 RepID=A0ABW6BH04_9SPHI|nr:ATP-binding protein [Sphingobacterium bambusae]WPL49546.1 ATP-binding protein [Sphingobacterium bambusae]
MPHTQKDIFLALNHSPEATAIYNNSSIRIAYVNLKMLEIWDKEADIIGSNFGDVFPEFREQGFDDILKNVWRSGETYMAENTAADVKVNGVLTRFYFDFTYKALQKNGETYAILHTAREVSERMAAWDKLAEKERIQKSLNEDLAASNEEIQAYAEEYQAINEKLQDTLQDLSLSYHQLQEIHDKLSATENRATYLLEQMPLAIGVYDVLTEAIQTGNHLFKDLWQVDDFSTNGHLSSFLSPIWQKFFEEMINRVRHTGKSKTVLDKKINTNRDHEAFKSFYNFVFQPIKNQANQVVAILIVANEVTDQKLEKEKVDLALEQARLAKKAAGFGVFDFDLARERLTGDKRCRQVLQLDEEKPIFYKEDFIERIHLQDRARVQQEIRQTFHRKNLNSHLSTTFLLEQAEEFPKIWVQLIGEVYYDKKGLAARFIGTIADVSEDMQLRQELLDREKNLQESNEELAVTMEELAATNEELLAINEELQRSKSLTEQVNTELTTTYNKLLVSEERLEVAIRSSQMGVWDVNFIDETLNWDARAKEIFGLDPEKPVPYGQRWNHIHDEDLPAVEMAVSMSKKPSSEGLFNTQFRTTPNEEGNSKWVQLQGQVYFSEVGDPVRFAGTVVDITEKIVSQQQIDVINRSIAQKEIEQRMIVDAGKIGTYSFDLQSKVVTTNKHLRELLQLDGNKDIWTERIFRRQVHIQGERQETSLLSIISDQELFDVEFELESTTNTNKIWLRSIGQSTFDSETGTKMVYGILLDITLQKLEEKRKMDFLGIVSHELKSPLTSLSGYIQILENKSKNLEDKLFSSLLANASRQNVRMRNLIEGFLDVARIGEGKLGLKLVSFDTQELLEQIRQTYMVTTDSHRMIFQIDTQHMLTADQDKIEQVIVNFINNAIKYAPIGSEIKIEATVHEEVFLVRVTDQGPGISADNKQKIFTRFFRVENEQTELISGFGIGLYICSEIIKLHGGQIGLDSEQGKGATFWFKVPIASSTITLL